MKKKIAVIGIGIFGSSIATTLSREGAEVVAIDLDENKIDDIKDIVSLAVIMDATDQDALKAQGLHECDVVVIAINDKFDQVVLITALLKQLGVRKIIARASKPLHRRILSLVGADELISPAEESGVRLGKMLLLEGSHNIIDLGEGYTIIEAETPADCVDKTVHDLRLRENYKINLITILKTDKSRSDKRINYRSQGVPHAQTRIAAGDVLVLFGLEEDIEKFIESNS
ncbi:TrkA family potassium uptake protein [Oscillatoria laete-virens NRMC-F 0139]|nr:TrkA family potassium uptake protein [Oscillatoria laete-virens]MDL5055223.1 TrkA family potassium uptake protein [Oscillatoria laete-virens NRMC-F 0139]